MTAVTASPAGVLGGGSLPVADWVEVLSAEYLARYLPAGGAAVKLAVVGDGEVAERLTDGLAGAAAQHRCLHVVVDAETTKLHLIEKIFFAVSGVVDWDALAATLVALAYDDVAFPAPPGRLSVAEVAQEHDVEPRELYRSVRRRLERMLLDDSTLVRELRRAVLRLCQSQLGAGEVDAAEREAVIDWLRGDLRAISALRPSLIFSRIGRHNARGLLASLSRLLLRAGYGGLVLQLDCARLAEARRPPVEARSGIYYSKAAVLDAYEVLRQLIDGTDELRGVLVVASLPPALVNDEARGLPSYAALHLRVADEVRDRRRANPFAALVRLEVRLEAVP